MPQVFKARANALWRATLAIALLVSLAAAALAGFWFSSPYASGTNRVPVQPVPFSHKHHAGELGLDCRYCHTTVEKSAFAGIPETEICMSCHSQIWTDAEMLAPVRDSLENDTPLIWQRVHDLPDFVHFDHSVHVNHGVPCEACHGRVDRMSLTTQEKPLFMQFCLDCHRNPAPQLRPPDAVFRMGYEPRGNPHALATSLSAGYQTPSIERLTDCSLCHQ